MKLNSGQKTLIKKLIIAVPVTAAVIFTLFFLRNYGKLISAGRTAVEMGTAVSLTVYEPRGMRSEKRAREEISGTLSRIFEEIDRVDRSVLSWRAEGSEIRQFNESGNTDPFPLSPELADVLQRSLALSSVTGGAVDITLRPLIALWGIEDYSSGQPYEPPSDGSIDQAASVIGTKHLTLNGSTLQKDDPAVRLDLGAVGKGYALDTALGILRQTNDVSGAILAAGGSILAYGSKDDPWQIGIRDPEGSPADYLGILSVDGTPGQTVFISTSGGYEKYAESGGIIYEHILDGRTLHPVVSDLYSATVITKDSGLNSDGLSTACYILGPEGSADLINEYQAEAIFVFRDRTIQLSPGLSSSFKLTNHAYSVAGTFAGSSENE